MNRKREASVSQGSPIEEYLKAVSEQVRWRQARPAIVAEIESHLIEQSEAYESQGMLPRDAEVEAVRQMGDPVVVGQALDDVHRPAAQWIALVAVACMAVAGAAAQLYCGVALDALWVNAPKTVVFTVFGITFMVVFHLVDCQAIVARHAWLVAGIVLSAACLVALMCDSGARMTALAHSFHSVTLTFPFVLALLLHRSRHFGWRGFAACILVAVPMVALAAFFGDIPQLFIMLVAAIALMAYAVAIDWFGVSRLCAAAVLVAAVVGGVAFFLLAGVLSDYLLWIPALQGVGQDPFGRYFTLLSGMQAVGGPSALGWGSGDLRLVAPQDCMPVALAVVLGRIPATLICVSVLVFAVWLVAGVARQSNRLYAMAGLAVSVVLIGQVLFSLSPFVLGIVFSSSTLPFLTPGFHNVVIMALVGAALSGLRHAAMPRVSERGPAHAS